MNWQRGFKIASRIAFVLLALAVVVYGAMGFLGLVEAEVKWSLRGAHTIKKVLHAIVSGQLPMDALKSPRSDSKNDKPTATALVSPATDKAWSAQSAAISDNASLTSDEAQDLYNKTSLTSDEAQDLYHKSVVLDLSSLQEKMLQTSKKQNLMTARPFPDMDSAKQMQEESSVLGRLIDTLKKNVKETCASDLRAVVSRPCVPLPASAGLGPMAGIVAMDGNVKFSLRWAVVALWPADQVKQAALLQRWMDQSFNVMVDRATLPPITKNAPPWEWSANHPVDKLKALGWDGPAEREQDIDWHGTVLHWISRYEGTQATVNQGMWMVAVPWLNATSLLCDPHGAASVTSTVPRLPAAALSTKDIVNPAASLTLKNVVTAESPR